MSNEKAISIALMASATTKTESPPAFPAAAAPPAAIAARMIQLRKENAAPALIKFFHKKAIAGSPIGLRVKGARFALRFFLETCQLPERTAATFSAIRWEASTEASSKATS